MLENKVGENIPSARDAAAVLENLKQVRTRLSAYCLTLSPEERKRLLRPRRGSEMQMRRVNDLAAKHEVKVPNVSSAQQANDLELASTMQPIADELRAIATMAEDTVGRAESEAWEAFLAQYAVLTSMATRMPELAAELQPVTNFMALGRRKREEDPKEPPK